MDAKIDCVAAYGILYLKNKAYEAGNKELCDRLDSFHRTIFTNAQSNDVGRREAKIADVLRAFASEVEKLEGSMDEWNDTYFLEQVCEGLGKALRDGLSVAANSARCLKKD